VTKVQKPVTRDPKGQPDSSFQVTPPESFPFSTPVEWLKWKRRSERFRIASGLHHETEEEQFNALFY